MSRVILPGSTLGVLGGGQLGRMFAIAARAMGYRVGVFDPEEDSPAGQLADFHMRNDFHDERALAEFGRNIAVATLEFENVPTFATDALARQVPVRPSSAVLRITQNRLREKRFLHALGLPVPQFAELCKPADIPLVAKAVGFPAVMKTSALGYDGKGQCTIHSTDEMERAWMSLRTECIVEQFVDFAAEVSLIAARALNEEFAAFPMFENRHVHHILDQSLVPARVPRSLEEAAQAMARAVLAALDVVGVMCIEFFVTREGSLLINELAPRPHNSGHATIDACVTDQFEQQVRAVCGLPLGSTRLLCPAAMGNLLGDLWEGGEPDWQSACRAPDVKLHLYGKAAARPRRKMGHLTALAESPEEALRIMELARSMLQKKTPDH